MGLHFSVSNIAPTVSFIRAVPSSPSLVLLFLQCLIHSGQIFKGELILFYVNLNLSLDFGGLFDGNLRSRAGSEGLGWFGMLRICS